MSLPTWNIYIAPIFHKQKKKGGFHNVNDVLFKLGRLINL